MSMAKKQNSIVEEDGPMPGKLSMSNINAAQEESDGLHK